MTGDHDLVGTETPGEPRKAWARFAAQETTAQKVLLAVAAMVTAVATIVGAGFALVQWLSPRFDTGGQMGDLTVRKDQVLVEQGSEEADTLVRDFVDSEGERLEINVMVVAGEGQENPQWQFHLWYNCSGLESDEPPGEDACDRALFTFDDQSPSPPRYDNPSRVEMVGMWANNRVSGLRYGAEGLEFFPVQASG